MKVFKGLSVLMISVLLIACAESEPTKLTNIKGLIPDLEFELSDENNKLVTAKGYLGSTVAVFFGFTSCPDICPTTMHQFASILKRVGEPAKSVKVLFVSVDPKRDSAEKLKKYTEIFGPAFIGLRGEDSTIKEMTKRYRVTFGYGDEDKEGNYEVSHSGAMFIFDVRGKARLLVTQGSSPENIVMDLHALLEETI
ncbi:MAG: cytochrome c oxidase assembly protein [Cycloclasticus sp. symbiont of Poecilosclerida sp. M]|nr:MAG: cytochrome c oxidase assembly protein [Cycloclasticus sp. symbiont of Poecilosclerida sp. M]